MELGQERGQNRTTVALEVNVDSVFFFLGSVTVERVTARRIAPNVVMPGGLRPRSGGVCQREWA
jgi:hypothetical protein